jgi:homoserine O-acetyltransferase
MTNDKQLFRGENANDATPAAKAQVREGVLAVPGELKLHFGGTLDSVSIAWRLTGPAGAPVVVAIGGISATRRVWQPDEPRGGWWHEVVGPGLALDTQHFRILSFDYLGASADSTGPRDGAEFPSVSAYDQAELLLRSSIISASPACGPSRALPTAAWSRWPSASDIRIAWHASS